MSGLGGGDHLEQEVGEVGGVGQVHAAPHHTSPGPLAVEVPTKLRESFHDIVLTSAVKRSIGFTITVVTFSVIVQLHRLIVYSTI